MKKIANDVDEKNQKASDQIDKIRRSAYLNSKGIRPNEEFQLSLAFPDTIGQRNDLRHIPNDYARSSLFTARNKKVPRRIFTHRELYHYNEHISILYTGIELRAEDDEIIWLQILNYGQSVPLGSPVDFSIKNLVTDVGWHKNGRYYDKARECISRLKATEIMALNSKAYGKSGVISLIHNYTVLNDQNGKATYYRIWINPDLMVLFAGNTFTSHIWGVYRKLSPVARRLADYIESHRHPYPLSVDKFRQMCGSGDTDMSSWRQTVRRACNEIQNAKLVTLIFLKKDTIHCSNDITCLAP